MNQFNLPSVHLYNSYFSLGEKCYQEKVRYYEDNYQTIQYLDQDLVSEIKIDYVLALFEIGRYQRFVDKVDEVIELVICDNIYEYKGENIYNLLLLRKASAYINMSMYGEAFKVLVSLISLDSDNELVRMLYVRCLRQQRFRKIELFKMIAIVSLLVGISIQLTQIFIIDPFFNEYLNAFHGISITLFALAAIMIGMNEWSVRRSIKKKLSLCK